MLNKKNEMHFVSVIDGLSSIEECVPKKSIDYMPDWWHKTPIRRSSARLLEVDAGNIKNCPGIKDYFAEGYILPMWTDLILYYDSDVDEWGYRVSDEKFKVSTHNGSQYLDYVPHKTMGENSYFIFKLASPWKLFTPKGYSSYQLPAFYHFNKDFSAAPGVRDTDMYHQLNLQILIHSDKKEIFIPRGTPLAQIVPFKRNKMDLNVRDASAQDIKKINAHELNFSSKFPGSKLYYKEKNK